MKIPREELIPILSQLNPWWRGAKISDLPPWRRGAFKELLTWVKSPPAHRAVLLSGPRQVGKTTLLLQVVEELIASGVPPQNILYATFDHPICKLAGLEAVLEAWRELEPKGEGAEYLFLDEAQFIPHIGTWIKHQVDFSKGRRIVFTGSAMPLIQADQESGVGRWHTIPLTTLSFYEYLQIKKIETPLVSLPSTLSELGKYTSAEYYRLSEGGAPLIGHFHEFLLRGGFPQTALVESITQSQKLLREDILEKVLKRDMTALFGVRRVVELEQMFVFLCLHDGGILDPTTISKELGIAKATVQNFIDLFVSAHLIYRLPPFGYGKEVLRGKSKVYLTDPAMAPAILMKGKAILEDPRALSQCVETAVMRHLSTYVQVRGGMISYWRNHKEKEVDLTVEVEGAIFPFEVKYQSQKVELRDTPGLIDFCHQKGISLGFILTKSPQDLGMLEEKQGGQKYLKIPASLFCYWLGAAEFSETSFFS